MSRYAAGRTSTDRVGAVSMPPTIGAAMRLMTSEPAPLPQNRGRRPATVMALGRTRSTAPAIQRSRERANEWCVHAVGNISDLANLKALDTRANGISGDRNQVLARHRVHHQIGLRALNAMVDCPSTQLRCDAR